MVPDTNMIFRWTVGNSGGSYFSAYFNLTEASTWQTITFQAADFGLSPTDLESVNFLQLRVIADPPMCMRGQ